MSSKDPVEPQDSTAGPAPQRSWKRVGIIAAAVAVVATIAIVVGVNVAGNQSAPVAEPDQSAEPAQPIVANHYDEVVVTTDWLADHLDDPSVRVIEVSTEPGLYERGHIPGAVNFEWATTFVDTVNRDIVDQETFTELAQGAGIDADTTVVLYGDKNNWFSAWGAWVFNLYGAEDVRILDGGRVKWEAEGRELAIAAPVTAKGDFEASEANLSLRAFLPEVLEVATEKATADLVDIRGPKEYSGEIFAAEGFQELAIRAGHIPTAVNVPWASAVAEDGTFKSVDELRAIYAEQGVDGSEPVIVYCRIGERASHTWFVLSQILGYDVKLYDGSWTEYGNSVGVPIQNDFGTVWGVS